MSGTETLTVLSSSSSSSSVFPAISLGFTIFGEIFAYVTVLFWGLGGGGGGGCFVLSQPRSSHIPSSWMVHAGCVIVAGIHP